MEYLGMGLLFVTILLIIITILWICVPFILLGTNKRLDKIISIFEEIRRSGALRSTDSIPVAYEEMRK